MPLHKTCNLLTTHIFRIWKSIHHNFLLPARVMLLPITRLFSIFFANRSVTKHTQQCRWSLRLPNIFTDLPRTPACVKVASSASSGELPEKAYHVVIFVRPRHTFRSALSSYQFPTLTAPPRCIGPHSTGIRSLIKRMVQAYFILRKTIWILISPTPPC